MLVHKTNKINRESVLDKGLIPNYQPRSSGPKGYVCVTTKINNFRPDLYDYWEVFGEFEVINCKPHCSRGSTRECSNERLIKGIIPPENLKLIV